MFFYERIKIRKLIGVWILFSIIIGIVIEVLGDVLNENIDGNLVQLIVNLGMFLWLLKHFKQSGNTISTFTEGLKKDLNWKEVTLLIIFHLTMTFGAVLTIMLALSYINPDIMYDVLYDDSVFTPETMDSKIFYAFNAVIFAPIIEEIAFRGIMLNRMKKKWGLVSAILISSILFGILHYKLAIIGALTFGICMSILYLRTKKIVLCMLTHCINNILATLFMFFPSSEGNMDMLVLDEIRAAGWVIGVPMIVISIVFLIYYTKKNWNIIKSVELDSIGKSSALVVIDMQEGLFSIPNEKIYDYEHLLEKSKYLIDKAREAKIPVIYIQHGTIAKGLLQQGTEGWHIHHLIAPVKGDLVIRKNAPNPFTKSKLKKELEHRNIDNIVVIGLQTEYCVDTTCRYAAGLGYRVTLVKDGHSTFDTAYLSAEKIIEHHNRALSNCCVNLRTTEDIMINGF